MAHSSMKTPLHIGVKETVTLPYTPTSDGFIQISCWESGAVNYFYTSVGSISTANGLTQSAIFPVQKGQQVTLIGVGNSSNAVAEFIPIVGGVTNRSYTYRTFSERRCA